jgi:adhesin transport system outer membrane protein
MTDRGLRRSAVAAAMVAALAGCAAPDQWRSLMQPDEDLSRLDNKDSFVESVTDSIKANERLTLLPQSDGKQSSLVIRSNNPEQAKAGDVVLATPYAEAGVLPDSIKKGEVRPQAVTNRYVDTLTALPVVTFQDMVKKTVLDNPEVKARWHDMKLSRYRRNEALAKFFPSVDFFWSISVEEYRRPNNVSLSLAGNGRSATVSYNLFNGFADVNETRQLDHELRSRYFSLLDISEEAAFEAARAHLDVLRYTKLTELARENLEGHIEVFKQIGERTRAGVDRAVDLELAAGRVALAKSNLATEEANLHDVSARYVRIVGVQPVKVTDSLPKSLTQKLPASLYEGTKVATERAPILLAAVENVLAAQMQKAVQRAAFLPKVDLRAVYLDGRSNAGKSGAFADPVSTATLTWNLYNGGSDAARQGWAEQLIHVSRYEHELRCREVRENYEVAFNRYKKLTEELAYLDQAQLSAEKAEGAYRQQFTIGQRTLLDLLDSKNELFESRRNYVTAEYALQTASAKLHQVPGTLLAALGLTSLAVEEPQTASFKGDAGVSPYCASMQLATVPFDKDAYYRDEMAKRPPPPPITVAATPAAPASRPAAPVMSITLSADAYFDFDKAILKPEGKSRLNEFTQQLKGREQDMLLTVGHTDSIGTDAYNDRLSLARAQSVRDYLVSVGIAAQRIKIEGRGEREPVADNKTAEGRAKNRRVEIKVIPPAK